MQQATNPKQAAIKFKAGDLRDDFEFLNNDRYDMERDSRVNFRVPSTRIAFEGWADAYVYYTRVEFAAMALRVSCHGPAKEAGWWTDLATGQDHIQEIKEGTRLGKALVAEKLCLVHSEISEAMEGHRKNLQDDKLPHRKMEEVEIADALIRALDYVRPGPPEPRTRLWFVEEAGL
jgi:hypothetical protein